MNAVRVMAVVAILAVALIALPSDVAWATHRATETCVDCSWWNLVCRLGNVLARCASGH